MTFVPDGVVIGGQQPAATPIDTVPPYSLSHGGGAVDGSGSRGTLLLPQFERGYRAAPTGSGAGPTSVLSLLSQAPAPAFGGSVVGGASSVLSPPRGGVVAAPVAGVGGTLRSL